MNPSTQIQIEHEIGNDLPKVQSQHIVEEFI
jgi:hypothetical protein